VVANGLAPQKTSPDRDGEKEQSDVSVSPRASKRHYSLSRSRSRERKRKSGNEGRKHRSWRRSKEVIKHESKDKSSKKHKSEEHNDKEHSSDKERDQLSLSENGEDNYSRSRSRERRHRNRSRKQKRSQSRSREWKKSRSRSRERKKSRFRNRKREGRIRSHSCSRLRHRHRTRSRSRTRKTKKRTEKPRRFSRSLSQTLSPPPFSGRNAAMDAQEGLARRLERVKKLQEQREKEMGSIPNEATLLALGTRVTPQIATAAQMAAWQAKAVAETGTAVLKKRKMRWQGKKEGDKSQSAEIWEKLNFGSKDQNVKFRKLMGIKSEIEAVCSSVDEESYKPLKQQEEVFRSLDAQYEMARSQTHTQRGMEMDAV
uniref:Arginine/serine-rich coiled-coil protein 2 n=1 Tax=Aotus nancymaae TaxID=37293 RepID=A0A2K5F1A3_AOTNA